MSPLQRSLKALRAAGWRVAIVEHWHPVLRIRQDLFGFLDLLAVRPGEVLGVQVTTGSHVADRAAKVRSHENLPFVLAAGIRVEVHGWRKLARSRRWECRIVEVDDTPAAPS